MMRRPEQIELETERLKAEYGGFFDSVAEILFRHDPIGIILNIIGMSTIPRSERFFPGWDIVTQLKI